MAAHGVAGRRPGAPASRRVLPSRSVNRKVTVPAGRPRAPRGAADSPPLPRPPRPPPGPQRRRAGPGRQSRRPPAARPARRCTQGRPSRKKQKARSVVLLGTRCYAVRRGAPSTRWTAATSVVHVEGLGDERGDRPGRHGGPHRRGAPGRRWSAPPAGPARPGPPPTGPAAPGPRGPAGAGPAPAPRSAPRAPPRRAAAASCTTVAPQPGTSLSTSRSSSATAASSSTTRMVSVPPSSRPRAALGDAGAGLPLGHGRARRRPHRPRDLDPRQAVPLAEGAQAPPELRPVAAEAVHPRPRVAPPAPVLGQRHGEDELPGGVTPRYGVCERMLTVCSPPPA